LHIVAERGQRNLCPSYWDMAERVYVAPYVANSGSGGQYRAWEAAPKKPQERKNLLFAKFRCTPYRVDKHGTVINVGKKMRHDIVKALRSSGDDVVVTPDLSCGDLGISCRGEAKLRLVRYEAPTKEAASPGPATSDQPNGAGVYRQEHWGDEVDSSLCLCDQAMATTVFPLARSNAIWVRPSRPGSGGCEIAASFCC